MSKIRPNLFRDAYGKPMRFYIKPCPTKGKVRILIEAGGGRLHVYPSEGVIRLAEPDTLTPHDFVSANYVFDSVACNTLQDISKYRSEDKGMSSSAIVKYKAKVSAGRQPYTAAEDEAIYDYIEKYGSRALPLGGNEIWKRMEKKKITSHSWQSMKDRYKKKLMRKHYRRAVKSQKVVEVIKIDSDAAESGNRVKKKPAKHGSNETSVTLWGSSSYENSSVVSVAKQEAATATHVVSQIVKDDTRKKDCILPTAVKNNSKTNNMESPKYDVVEAPKYNAMKSPKYDAVVGHEYDSQVILPQRGCQNGMISGTQCPNECPVVGIGEAYNSDVDYENIRIDEECDNSQDDSKMNDEEGCESFHDLLTISSKSTSNDVKEYVVMDKADYGAKCGNNFVSNRAAVIKEGLSILTRQKDNKQHVEVLSDNPKDVNNSQLRQSCNTKRNIENPKMNFEFSKQVNDEILNKYFYCDFGYELQDTKTNDGVTLDTHRVQELRRHHEWLWQRDMRKDTNEEVQFISSRMQMAEVAVANIYRAVSGNFEDTRYFLKYNKTKDGFSGWTREMDAALINGDIARLKATGITEKRILQQLHYLSTVEIQDTIQSMINQNKAT